MFTSRTKCVQGVEPRDSHMLLRSQNLAQSFAKFWKDLQKLQKLNKCMIYSRNFRSRPNRNEGLCPPAETYRTAHDSFIHCNSQSLKTIQMSIR